ncbi:MAG: Ig-like domain-containing protein [Anaerolineales bacterium]|nr:Ig-like domain-containing protein [Anaerolineales bacterium]
MHDLSTPSHRDRLPRLGRVIPGLMIILSLACALPTFGKPTPTSTSPASTPTVPPAPTPTPQPLPPGLVESSPPSGGEVPPEGPITLYFNQAMDHASVEATLTSQFNQEITFTWIDDRTVVLYLSSPLAADINLVLGADVRSAQGLNMSQEISLDYRMAGPLRLAQRLPGKDLSGVDPSAAVVTSFNRPVVPLGAEPGTLPAAFTLQPAAQGRGEWVNTSTYIFYPDPPLMGGSEYTVQMNTGLKSTDGSLLQDIEPWSFSTAQPRLLSIDPVTEIPWPLDAEVVLTFNQPMDAASVEADFALLDLQGSPVAGSGSWSEDLTAFTFKPAALLQRNASYNLQLGAGARSLGGASLESPVSASVITVQPLALIRSEPAQGGEVDASGFYGSVALYFNVPLSAGDIEQYFMLTPAVADLRVDVSEAENSLPVLRLSGPFSPNTSYELVISADLPDIWGGLLGQPYRLGFRTGPVRPDLLITTGSDALFVLPQESSLRVQVTNLPNIPMTVGSVPLNDFFDLLGPNGYQARRSFQSPDQRSWSQAVEIAADRSQPVDLSLTPDRSQLLPGLYFLRFDFSDDRLYSGPYLLVVSNLQVTYKASATQALVWVVDLRTNLPLSNAPVTIFDEAGNALAHGQTGADGTFTADLAPLENPYALSYAVVGQAPGDTMIHPDSFGMAISSWSQGVSSWDFGLRSEVQPPGLKIYFYTDRPIYRPGQTVYFRAIARQAYNGRYTLPDLSSLPVTVVDDMGQQIASLDLPLNAFGAAHGQYSLPAEARPGYYSLDGQGKGVIGFQVANYRKPEINLQVSFAPDQALAGQTLNASVEARYFFDAPASDLQVHWALYANRSSFDLPGYLVGPEDNSWLEVYQFPYFGTFLGDPIAEGDAQTGSDGRLALELPTEADDARNLYTLEVTVQDESGLPVSARAAIQVNPADFYIGLRPDVWVGQVDQAAGFDVLVVDWDQAPAGEQELRAEFSKVVWERTDPSSSDLWGFPTFKPVYTLVASTDFATAPDGKARLAFTPQQPGTFQLAVFDPDVESGTRTEFTLWVGGSGQAIWPNLPNSRLRLVANQQTYQPGEIARVFIPNPLQNSLSTDGDAQALITVERGVILSHQVITIGPEGYTLELPLTGEHAPNVYLSVTLLNGPDFRQGYVNLPVEPLEQTLQVTLLSQPERTGPGDEVSFDVQVTDVLGSPVQGEFSLAVVDLAALALAEPNSVDILPAFYSQQPLGVSLSLSLAAYTRRLLAIPGGLGGGGGGDIPSVVRENFPDTAYWNAELITGPDGKARVTVILPDTLTTWQVDLRGLTLDTRVGQAKTQIVTSKELLIRPVTPRFLVVDDHAQLAAIVQNTSAVDLQVQVSLQASGFTLDEPARMTQQVSLPAGSRQRLEWWGVVQGGASLDLVFSASGKDAAGNTYNDAARPAQGDIPVLRYTARQTFRTAGLLDSAGEIQELVSLPRSFTPQDGELIVELAPTLGATMLQALEVLESYPDESTEATLSHLLPNLETYRALQQYNIEDAALKARLDKLLNTALLRIQSRQNMDGGWGWQLGADSDPYISAYVLFGLERARQAGISLSADLLQRAVEYLQTSRQVLGAALSPKLTTAELDRLVFEDYALVEYGAGNQAQLQALYQVKEKLSPWAQALLALSLEQLTPGSGEAAELLSSLQTGAARSATGVYWSFAEGEAGRMAAQLNMHTTLSNSAVVIYALAKREAASPLVADALRYLMYNRQADGGWYGTYTTAWSLIALAEVVKGTGELGGSFSFTALLNNNLLAQGQAGSGEQLNPVVAQMPVKRLYADYPNQLTIRRDGGQGRLYYTASLNVSRPVAEIAPLSQGLSVQRAYYPAGEACPQGQCAPVQFSAAGQKITVRLTLTLAEPVYYLAVEDYIPAGAEILDTRLKTSQLGEDLGPQTQAQYDPRHPFANGWGWWWFDQARIYDDHIAWTASYLPEGVYELTYTLIILQPGLYQVLPAHAWQLYFPEVQANSAGGIFEIKP